MDRADSWNLGGRTLRFGRLPLLMGIVNVTPDSFSDGGQHFEPAAAVEHGLRLVEEGAAVIDVGGQSTRPGSAEVDAEEELRRVLPVVRRLAKETSTPISIDTSKAPVARAALEAGALVVNDVTALSGDAAMIDVLRQTGAGVCLMHMQGTPRTMQENPVYQDVVQEVLDYLRRRRDALVDAGIDQSRIALDPGVGFGKTTEHNLALLRAAARLHSLGCPVLIGHSRKRFIARVQGDDSAERTSGTIGVALSLARAGVQLLRVHDVAAVRRALVLFEAAGGLG